MNAMEYIKFDMKFQKYAIIAGLIVLLILVIYRHLMVEKYVNYPPAISCDPKSTINTCGANKCCAVTGYCEDSDNPLCLNNVEASIKQQQSQQVPVRQSMLANANVNANVNNSTVNLRPYRFIVGNLDGNDIELTSQQYKNINSYEDCFKTCYDTPNCSGATYKPQTNYCHIKSNYVGPYMCKDPQYKDGWISSPKIRE